MQMKSLMEASQQLNAAVTFSVAGLLTVCCEIDYDILIRTPVE